MNQRLAHEANEWADMATNGIQWVKNIIDGISTPEKALESLAQDLKHCRSVSKETQANQDECFKQLLAEVQSMRDDYKELSPDGTAVDASYERIQVLIKELK